MISEVLMVYATMLAGKLGWNLTQTTSHSPGAVLQFFFSITNNTTTERQFKVWIALFDQTTGAVIEAGPLPETFIVAGESEQSFPVSSKVNYSNCIMQASLYDITTGEMGAALQTILEQPPGTIEQISPIFGMVAAVLVLSLVVSFIPKMLKG